MDFSSVYFKQVELLLQVLPFINEQDCFALKGGTAINLFVLDMPRLSVDIDLAYLPIEPRDEFLKNLTLALQSLSSIIKTNTNGTLQIKETYTKETKQLAKLLVYDKEIMVKIEPNLVLRGSVFECETRDLCQQAQDQFLQFTRVRTLSFADLYGGKICAALSRQHPRDLFDIKILLENEGLTEAV